MSKELNALVSSLTEVVKNVGAAVLEYSECPHCRRKQYHAHLWAESITCQFFDCGKRYPSTVPRRPDAGEVNEIHFKLALTTLGETYTHQQEVELPPLQRAEVAAQSPEVQLLLARACVGASKHVLEKLAALAEEYAKLNVNPALVK